MAWLKVSFSPVVGAAALVGLGLAFLATARFAGRETRVFFAEAFFAFGFFISRHSILLRPSGASMVGATTIVKQAVILRTATSNCQSESVRRSLSSCARGDV